ESLSNFADELEGASDFTLTLNNLIRRVLREHKRIIFNGNGYDPAWVEEAEKRGLLNLKTTVDALPAYVAEKNIELFVKHGVFSESEVHSRYEIKLENYVKVINIEAQTTADMARKLILPAALEYSKEIAKEAELKKAVAPTIPLDTEIALLNKLSTESAELAAAIDALDKAIAGQDNGAEIIAEATYTRDSILAGMAEVRKHADALEVLVAKKYWPMPTYQDLLLYV
ncbi:MAG TPA: glutamine synthetase, partial [Candidatus Limiplasma sp.]|nr:glutamine synthetase [Candidatus Limiplasma sp.]